jgi:hypothetical protein
MERLERREMDDWKIGGEVTMDTLECGRWMIGKI